MKQRVYKGFRIKKEEHHGGNFASNGFRRNKVSWHLVDSTGREQLISLLTAGTLKELKKNIDEKENFINRYFRDKNLKKGE